MLTKITPDNPFLDYKIRCLPVPEQLVTAAMENPGFATKYMFNTEIFAFQNYILRAAYDKPFPLLVASRGFSKTFLLALYSLFRAVFDQGSKVVLVSKTYRQCLVGESVLFTENGIKFFSDIPEKIIVSDLCGNNKIKHKWKNEIQPTKKIITKNGYELEGAFCHKIMNNGEWVNLESVNNGDKVNIYYNQNIFSETNKRFNELSVNNPPASFNKMRQPKFITEDIAWFLGKVFSSSYCGNKDRFKFRTKDKYVIDKMLFILKNGFNLNAKLYSNSKKHYSKVDYLIVVNDNFLYAFLKHNDFDINIRQIPSVVFDSSKKIIRSFLSSYFEENALGKTISDSSVSVVLRDKNKNILNFIHVVLLNFGIISKKKKNSIEISSRFNCKKFFENIGFPDSGLNESLYNSIKDTSSKVLSLYNNIIFDDTLKDIFCKINVPTNIWIKFLYKRIISVDELKIVAAKYDKVGLLDNYIIENVFCDEVVETSKSKNITYDIEVDKSSRYCANGFLNHNSLFIFDEIIKIYNRSPILKGVSKKPPTKATTAATFFVGDSSITAIPLGSDGTSVRGMRATVILADERSCLDANTLIETDYGLMRISDYGKNFDAKLFTGDKKQKKETPEHFIITKPRDCYKIETQYQYSFICSDIHRVMTNSGWKLAKDLTADDFLLYENNYVFPKNKVVHNGLVVDKNLAWLLGFLVAEGSINSKHSIAATTTDIISRDRVLELFRKNKLNTNYYTRSAYIDKRGRNCKESYYVNACCLKFRNLLCDLGLERTKSHGKKIPWSILQSPRDVVIEFLKGLFSGDGSFFVRKNRNKWTIEIVYYSVSEQLCSEVQVMLSKLGIQSSKSSRISKLSDNKQWSLKISAKNIKEFLGLVNNNFIKTVEKKYNLFFHDRTNEGIIFDKSRDVWMLRYYDKIKKKTIQVGQFKEFSDAQNAKKEFDKTKKTYFRIKGVEKVSGKRVLYDFYLPKTHSFYGNCFKQHNSISDEIFQTVIRAFASVAGDPIQRVKTKAKINDLNARGKEIPRELRLSTNQIFLTGTAYYQSNSFYKTYQSYRNIIDNKIKGSIDDKLTDEIYATEFIDYEDYIVFHMNYRHLPDGFMDEKQMTDAKMSMSSTVFDMEFNSIFISDSGGFFKHSDIEKCYSKNEDRFSLEMHGDSDANYVLGIDPSTGGTDAIAGFCIIRLGSDFKRIVRIIGLEKYTYPKAIALVKKLLGLYNIVAIGMDVGGGGRTLEESLKNPDLMKNHELLLNIEEEDKKINGRRIIEMVQPKSSWILKANQDLQADLHHRRILFPVLVGGREVGSDIEEIRKNMIVAEDAEEQFRELISEMESVEMTIKGSGVCHFDVPKRKITVGGGKRVLTGRKDLYSSLLLANYIADKNLGTTSKPARYSDSSNFGGWAESFLGR